MIAEHEIPVRFAADCQPCEWEGPARASNLTALADFDRHSAGHRGRLAVELCIDCGHAADGHDRRAEDGSCEACDPGGSCYRGVFR
jgi:hypothetical protein